MIKVAINGFGRIGRMVLRSIYENKFNKKIKVVAINNKASADISPVSYKHLTLPTKRIV